MAGKVFVNYRRDDERSTAARVRDRLAGVFGVANVFMDVDNLLAGQRFDRELEKALAETDVFLAVIGPKWMELFAQRQASGERDYVREEIAGALKRGILVIPVLIERAPMPRGANLPEDIREMVLHQKHDISHERFGRDIEELVVAINAGRKAMQAEAGSNPIRAVPWSWVGATAASVIVVGWVGAYYAGVPVPWPSAQSTVERQSAGAVATPQVAVATPPPAAPVPKLAQPAVANRSAPPAARCDGVEAQVGNERRCLKPGSGKTDWFKDCPTCPEMVVAPTGRFTMGSPSDEPKREPFLKGSEDQLPVTISKPFAVARFAVTRGEFAAFVTATNHKAEAECYAFTGTEWKLQADRNWRSPGFPQTDRHPVVCVNWSDAMAYVAWLVSTTGQGYRLLSESEREYTARAGTTTPFWWGKSISASQANYDANYTYDGGAKGESRKATVPVDSFVANPWGLYNVHGNVWEWSEDCWNANNVGNSGDGKARTSGDCSFRVLRGGSWGDNPRNLRSADRGRALPDIRSNFFGFRVARTL